MIPSFFKRRAFSGGLHFDRLSTLCFDLEGIALELSLPASDAKWQNPPRALNYPFNSTGWFEKNCERFSLNDSVHLHTEIWGYYPVRLTRIINLAAMGSNEPMGKLSLGVHLNKLQEGQQLDPFNSRSLGNYIKWEYEDFYESPEQGPYGKGNNYEVRAKYGRMFRHNFPEQDEVDRQQYNAALSSELAPTPDHFDLLSFGGALWTCFQLDKLSHMSTRHYCVALSKSYYLQIYIRFHFDQSRYRAVIEPDMLSATEWLVQHIKIAFPGKPNGPLALPR